jgi:hypothetical protein
VTEETRINPEKVTEGDKIKKVLSSGFACFDAGLRSG